MGPYADYRYYAEEYRGSAVPEADFPRLSRQASSYLDQVTFGRIRGSWETNSRVRDACCALAEQLHQEAQGGEVVSASNDGYSETYASSGKTAAQRRYETAAAYLAVTGLLYQGGGCPCF